MTSRRRRLALSAAAAVWAGTVLVRVGRPVLAVAACGSSAAWRPMVGILCLAGVVSGALSNPAPVREGRVDAVMEVRSDPLDRTVMATMAGETVVVEGPVADLQPGDRIRVRGRIRSARFRMRGAEVVGRIDGERIDLLGSTSNPFLRLANRMRRIALERIEPGRSSGRALLAGFLLGETGYLEPLAVDAMRRAGLAHFVAVSGSNVALFLGLWWLLLAGVRRPWVRWASGLPMLGVFVFLTRWEPSVIRAAVMAGLVLAGKLVGLHVDGWEALGWTVVGVLVAAPGFSADVGFILSVAATIGVMTGHRWIRVGPFRSSGMLGATMGAQAAVAPILVATFGSVPVLAPVANLLAAPLVSLASLTGALGVITGVRPLVGSAGLLARAVLWVAEVAAPWPQIGWPGLGLLGGAWMIVHLRRELGPPVVLMAAGLLAAMVWPGGAAVRRPAVVFLDVGQGDAALILGQSTTVLIDGGPDPILLQEKLSAYGVTRVDIVVASHVHADHLQGLTAVVGRVPVGQIWQAFGPHTTEASRELLDTARRFGVEVVSPPVGTVVSYDDVTLEVLGPRRRYAQPNDQSLVLLAEVGDRSFLFPGDVETFAQADLGRIGPDVLKVPHQGAATSDPTWLAANAGRLAVISVGPNTYGHPVDWVVETLTASGARVWRTDLDGDLVLELPANQIGRGGGPRDLQPVG